MIRRVRADANGDGLLSDTRRVFAEAIGWFLRAEYWSE